MNITFCPQEEKQKAASIYKGRKKSMLIIS